MAHPAEGLLERFALVQATRRENREVVAHLLKGCGACSRRITFHLEAGAAAHLDMPTYGDRPDRRERAAPAVV